MQLNLTLQFELGDAAQIFAQDFFLDVELMLVGGVLVVASAAEGEIGTGWRHAVRGGLKDFRGMGSGEAGFHFGQRGLDFLSGQNEGDESGFAAALSVGGQAS